MTTRYEDNSHAHYLTFGCFQRKHLFAHHDIACNFIKQLDRWRTESLVQLWAFVVMPNHVHLLVHDPYGDFGRKLSALKRTFS